MVSTPVPKRLFARSGNTCAFPGCSHILVDDDGHVSDILPIAARRLSGPRYDSAMTAGECDSFENLILLVQLIDWQRGSNDEAFDRDATGPPK